ncbi:hypothetical protein [Allofournierella sp.]|uniref:hypothetical protein n=1 Tax=Allofournierella sp. TaxID=1940256 RepID=UPI003AB7245B
MMNEEDLKRRFCALFDPLHTSVSAGAVLARAHALPRRKKLRPLRVLAACVCLLLACTLAVGAGRLLRQWPSVFGGQIQELEPPADLKDATFYARQEGYILPEGAVAFHEFDLPEDLPEGQGSAAGVYELADGSIFLRRAGQETDEDLTGRFAGEVWDFLYNGQDGQAHTATALGSCAVEYERLGETVTMTITQVRHESGLIGYLLVRACTPGQSGFLYAPGTDFEVECLMQLGRLTA